MPDAGNPITSATSRRSPRTIDLRSEMSLLDGVVKLADDNADTLGHFPRGAFERLAKLGNIIAAVEGQEVLGFVLFRTNRRGAVIQDLCVAVAHRRKGVARQLVEALCQRVKHLPEITCHCAREYGESLKAWTRLGFSVTGEKEGRGASRRPLIRLARKLGHADLFDSEEDRRAAERLIAVVDMNVALELKRLRRDGPSGVAPEIRALEADWLGVEVMFLITPESRNESIRQDADDARRDTLNFLRDFPTTKSSQDSIEMALGLVRSALPSARLESDDSDQHQCAHAVACGADAFLTLDEGLLRHHDQLMRVAGLEVLRPGQFIAQIDELLGRREYQPALLSGSRVAVRRVTSRDLDVVADTLRLGDESPRKLHAKLRSYAVDDSYDASVIEVDGGRLLGFACIDFRDQCAARIVELRLADERLGRTIARQAVVLCIRAALQRGRSLIALRDQAENRRAVEAAIALGFERARSKSGELMWLKWSTKDPLPFMSVSSMIESALDAASLDSPRLRELARGGVKSDPVIASEVERLIWPGRISDANVPTFVVPIQPRWARHLIDSPLVPSDLFGGDPHLVLNCENVYYRADAAPQMPAPARILWYVSGDGADKVQALTACSTLIESLSGAPKELFRRYQRLGVFNFQDVRTVAERCRTKHAMALRFGPTQALPRPMKGRDLRELLRNSGETRGSPPLSAPLQISQAAFNDIMRRTHG